MKKLFRHILEVNSQIFLGGEVQLQILSLGVWSRITLHHLTLSYVFLPYVTSSYIILGILGIPRGSQGVLVDLDPLGI